MMAKLLALSVGVAMLSGAGFAQAADVTPADVQSKAAPPAMELTDTQMQKLTAGHYYKGKFHRGWYHNRQHQLKYGLHETDYGPEGDRRHGPNRPFPGRHRGPH
jgi:hypothetical protein